MWFIPYLLLFVLSGVHTFIEWQTVCTLLVTFAVIAPLLAKGLLYKYRQHATNLGNTVITRLNDISSQRHEKAEASAKSGLWGIATMVLPSLTNPVKEFNTGCSTINNSAAEEVRKTIDFIKSYDPLPLRRCMYMMALPSMYTLVVIIVYLFDLSMVYHMAINLFIGGVAMWYCH